VLSVWLLLHSWLSTPSDTEQSSNFDRGNLVNLLCIAGLTVVSTLMMVWAGPILVDILGGMGVTDKTYRQLSATVPYKYVGFALGGFVMVFGLIVWVEGRLSWRAAAVAAGMVAFLILLYDVPFSSLLLPPNGSI